LLFFSPPVSRLPVNFSIVISEHISDNQVGISAWAYPLLMLLASITIFPLLWSGIAVQSSSPLQDYLFAIPALIQHPIAAGLRGSQYCAGGHWSAVQYVHHAG